jgi:hypothetical protein
VLGALSVNYGCSPGPAQGAGRCPRSCSSASGRHGNACASSRVERGVPRTFRSHPPPVLHAPSTVTGTGSTTANAARSAAPCAPSTVTRHRFCLHLPRSWVWPAPQLVFLSAIPIASPSACSLRSGAVVILTSASRSGGEVRITEAERPPHVIPGRRGCQTGIAARSVRTAGAVLYGHCVALPRGCVVRRACPAHHAGGKGAR